MSKTHRINIKDVSRHNKYQIQGIFVYTPYQIYQPQQTFMTYIVKCLNQKKNALIQSPTGTGKTILGNVAAIKFKITATSNNLRIKDTRSAEASCQLDQQTLLPTQNLHFKQSRSLLCKLRSKTLEGARQIIGVPVESSPKERTQLPVLQSTHLIIYNEAYYQKQAELGKIMDLQQITLKGKLEGFCPFFYQRFSRAVANIVLVPYNYLFDKKIWAEQDGFRLQGSIVILDQAHNIQSVCEQYRQYSISLSTLVRATQQAEQLRSRKLNQNKTKLDPGQLDKIKMMKLNLEDIEINAAYIQLIYQHLQTLDIPTESNGSIFTAVQFSNILDKATQPSEFGTLSRNIKAMISSFENIRTDMMFTPFWALESWMKFIERLQELINQKQGVRAGLSQYAIQVVYEGADIKVYIHCLDPQSGFKEVLNQHKPHSIILTSGTLSPLKFWSLELGVEFAQPVSCPHVLSPSQASTVILGVGASGHALDIKFQNRKQARLYEDIGQALYQIVKNVPNGVVVLFPSYSFMENTKNHLTTLKVLTKLYECKNIYFERKDSSDFATILERYMKDAQTDKGALLFALVRGRISQGLDFAHKKCRAVVLVGVPYPCSKDVKVVAKMNYLDMLNKNGQVSLTGSQWYLAETVRAINQGIGRLIRTPDDFGSVYLLDSRFTKSDIEGQIASWARTNLSKPATFQQFVQKVHSISNSHQKPDLVAIQQDLGFISNKGTVIGPQILIQPPKIIRGSISRVPQKDLIEKLAEQRVKNLTLQDMISNMKSEKSAKDEAKKQQQDMLQLLKIKEESNKMNYERRIFMKKTVKPLNIPKEICPVCQLEAAMVKSNTCQHSLCQQCWNKWLDQDLRCPMCRGRVRKNFLVPEI